MTFPTGTTLSTSGLDNGSDSPASARLNIKTAIETLNSIIESPNTANNVCVLDGNGQVPSSSIPGTVTTSSDLILRPGSETVKIEKYLRMQIVPKATVLARTDNAFGDTVLYADDLTGANAGLAIWDGTEWKVVYELGTLTALS